MDNPSTPLVVRATYNTTSLRATPSVVKYRSGTQSACAPVSAVFFIRFNLGIHVVRTLVYSMPSMTDRCCAKGCIYYLVSYSCVYLWARRVWPDMTILHTNLLSCIPAKLSEGWRR